jgi:hypothetical protein
MVEFDHLKDHFDPFVKAGLATDPSQRAAPSSVRPGLPSLPSKYGSLMNLASRARTPAHHPATPAPVKDELPPYVALAPCAESRSAASDQLDFLRNLKSFDDVAPLPKRATAAWHQSLQLSYVFANRPH